MTFKVGRIEFDCVEDPPTWRVGPQGPTLNVRVSIGGDGMVDATRGQIEQVKGLTPGLRVPVTWTEDNTFDDYYTVVNAQTSMVLGSLDDGYQEARLQLLRSTEDAFEWSVGSTTRDTTYYVSTGTYGWVYWPEDAGGSWVSAPIATSNERTTEDGDLRAATTTAADDVVHLIAPADYYKGAARIEQDVAGTAVRVQSTNWPDPAGDPESVRMSNGLVSLEWVDESIKLRAWTSADGWHDAGTFRLEETGVTDSQPSAMPRIVRNDVLGVAVRFPVAASAWSASGTVEIGLRRGDLYFTFVSDIAALDVLYAETPTAATATSPTGAIYQTTPASSGVQWTMGTPNQSTFDLVNGKITFTTTAASWYIGVGANVEGASNDQPNDLRKQYWTAVTERQRPVNP